MGEENEHTEMELGKALTETTIIGRSHRGGIRFKASRAVAEAVQQFPSVFGDVQYDNAGGYWEIAPDFQWTMHHERYSFITNLILAIHNELHGAKMAAPGSNSHT